jgi:hypothetical protein
MSGKTSTSTQRTPPEGQILHGLGFAVVNMQSNSRCLSINQNRLLFYAPQYTTAMKGRWVGKQTFYNC